MDQNGLRKPTVQANLENEDPNSPIGRAVLNLQQQNLSNEDYVQARRTFLVFLTAQSLYDNYVQENAGVRRRQMLDARAQQLAARRQSQGSAPQAGSSAVSGTPSARPQAPASSAPATSAGSGTVSQTPNSGSSGAPVVSAGTSAPAFNFSGLTPASGTGSVPAGQGGSAGMFSAFGSAARTTVPQQTQAQQMPSQAQSQPQSQQTSQPISSQTSSQTGPVAGNGSRPSGQQASPFQPKFTPSLQRPQQPMAWPATQSQSQTQAQPVSGQTQPQLTPASDSQAQKDTADKIVPMDGNFIKDLVAAGDKKTIDVPRPRSASPEGKTRSKKKL